MVKLHCSDQVVRHFNYKQHIPVNSDTGDALHVLTRRGKINDYDWLS
jgi:hypothetical protein